MLRLSQVLAGALKDNGRARIVGERTFGKGLIQTIVELTDGSGVAVTVARYQTPAGTDINKVCTAVSGDHMFYSEWPNRPKGGTLRGPVEHVQPAQVAGVGIKQYIEWDMVLHRLASSPMYPLALMRCRQWMGPASANSWPARMRRRCLGPPRTWQKLLPSPAEHGAVQCTHSCHALHCISCGTLA
jgi:hypothetical protein